MTDVIRVPEARLPARTPEEASQQIDKIQAVRAISGKLGLTAEEQRDLIWLEASKRAERADLVEELRDAGKLARQGDNRHSSRPDTLSGLGLDFKEAERDRLAREAIGRRTIDDVDYVKGMAQVYAWGRAIKSGIDPEHGDDWYTPRWMFDQLGLRFDIDVCAPLNPDHRTCPADTYFTINDDGLAQDWQGLVWCNPPYSDATPWAEKWVDHPNGLLLTHIPANARWAVKVWQAADAIVLLQKVEFSRPNGENYRPGYSLQLAARGDAASDALHRLEAPMQSPVWRP